MTSKRTEAILIATLLAFVAVFQASQAHHHLFEPGNEYIYNYNAKINVGTFKPAIFASQFILDGKLHVQHAAENTLFMRLSELNYKLYNGELNYHDEYQAKSLPIPIEAEDLSMVFEINYEKGKIENITTDHNDRKFSTDMKKAIASLIQLDLPQIKFNAKTPYAFVSNEKSIYGNVVTRYNIMPDESEMIVQKMLNVQTSEHWLSYFGSTESVSYEDIKDRSAVSIDAHREYKLQKGDNGFYVNSIDSQGGVFSHMMKGFTETQFMYVNQTLHLTNKIPISEKMIMKEKKTIFNDISFQIEATETEESVTNLSFGRNEISKGTIEKIVDGILDEVVVHTNIQKLHPKSPSIKQGQGVNRLHRLMSMFQLSDFEKTFLSLQEDSNSVKFKIFQEMIPLIGTKASIKFIRNLIRKEKINDETAIEMLQKMPFYLKTPSEDLLKQIEDLITMENVSPYVHRTAVLSFATLIYKTYSHYMIENKLVKIDEQENLLEKYILKYLELLKTSQDYISQYLYIHGLYNIRIGNVMKYLEPYVKGEATTNQHLRYLAMCASFVEAIKDPKYAFEVYWPIFADTTLDLELRVGAYLILINTKLSDEKLMDVYWILKRDPNSELYNFHYTHLKSLVNTQDSILKNDQNSEMLNFMREPYRPSKTGSYMADYKDPKYGFGAMNNIMLHSTNTSKSIFMNFGTNMYNFQVMNYGLWLKIDGIDASGLLNWSHAKGWMEQLKRMFISKELNKINAEYAILYNDKIIQLNYIEYKDSQKLLEEISQILPKSSLSISYELIMQQIMPNDLGMPTVFEILIPNLINNHFEEVPSKEGTCVQEHWKYQRSSHAKIGTSFYNSIVDVWQGAERVQANEIIANMSFSFTKIEPDQIKFTLYDQNDDTRDKFAMRNYASTATYVYKDVNNALQKSSRKSEHFAIVSRGEIYRKNTMVFEYDCPHTGFHFTIDVFDTKRRVSLKTIMEYVRNTFQRRFKNYETMPFGYMLLTLQSAAHQVILSPECGTFGLLLRVTPSKQYPVKQVDILLHHDSERLSDENTLKMLNKHNMKASWTTQDIDNQVMNTWEIKAKLLMDMDHHLENFNIHYIKKTPDMKNFELCMDGDKEMLNNKITRHINITKGYLTNGQKCNDDIGKMSIKINEEQSAEQLEMIENKMEYDQCMSKHMHDPHLNGLKINYNKGFDCIQMKTSLRKQIYTCDINMKEYNYTSNYHSFKMVKGLFYPYYSIEKMNNVMDENKHKIIIEYPTIGDEINVEIMVNNMKHKYSEMPIYFLKYLGLHPKNYYYSNMFMKLKHMQMIDSCLITEQHIYNNREELTKIVDDEWMRVVYTNPTHINKNAVVFVKQIGEQMALKINLEENILEIMPNNNRYIVTLNGKEITLNTDSYIEEKLFYIGMINDQENTIIINLFNYPFYINYDGEHIEMHKSVMDVSLIGTCFMY